MILDTRQDPVQGAFGQYMTGPWARWFDALLAAGGGNVRINAPRGSGNPSNQFRGYSTQPDYLTTGKTFMGRPTSPKPPAGMTAPALEGLQQAGPNEGYWQGSKRRAYTPSGKRQGQSYMRVQGQRGGPRA